MGEALFTPVDGERVLPGPLARGPWSPEALHGGPVGALLAGAAEPLLEDLHPARVTIELLRPVPVAPLLVRAQPTRPGRKVRLVVAEILTEDGTIVASGTFLGIRRADVPSPPLDPPDGQPVGPDAVERASRAQVATADDYDAFHNVGVEHRFVSGAFKERGRATDWIRLTVPVVDGAVPTPLQRVLAAADFSNGISSVADFSEMTFINPDLTVHLHRLPVGEWVCLEASTWLEDQGVGLAQSRLWDERGVLGRSLQSLLVEAR